MAADRCQNESANRHYEEGGWGWIVVIATFTAEMIVFGNIKALGVFVETIAKEFDTDLWLTGWVASLSLAVQLLMGPLLLPLLRMFGCRPVLLLSGVMATVGYILAAQSHTFVEWGVFVVCFAGLGSGCFIYALVSLLATYFKKYYPLVVLIGDLGMSCGTLIYGPITQVLLDTYGWRWAMMIIAGLTFHLVPVAAVAKTSNVDRDQQSYHRIPQTVERSPSNTSPRLQKSAEDEHCCSKMLATFDFGVLTDVRFLLVSLACCVVAFCFVGWAVYVVPHGIDQGLSPMQASFLPTSFAVGNIIGKLVATLFVQIELVQARWAMCIGALLASIFFFVDPFMASYAGLLIVTMVIGTGNAICNTVKLLLFRNMTSDDRLLGMLMWQGLFLGFSDVLSGFASGKYL
ncbi:monocarboxylate transporter 11-like [Patiria miniata]|uniref:Major facilitator superfamily (MFS) profile domain-containing protein n=1 Tax=Patiria miniata TaxID=46514 RepID=A0A914A8D0_PATMI|nr:monocarboxylate transporter 11-like [Patiria miniata]